MTNEDNTALDAALDAAAAAFEALDNVSDGALPDALPENWREEREEDDLHTAAIQDGRIAVYAISMAIVMQANGVEYAGTAEWKHEDNDGAEVDFSDKTLDWFEANCELLDIDWEDESVENELDGEDLTQTQAMAEEFHFDLDVERTN